MKNREIEGARSKARGSQVMLDNEDRTIPAVCQLLHICRCEIARRQKARNREIGFF
jgi:hypothetical protein